MVKTNTKLFFMATIVNITKYWPGGYYVVLRSNTMVPEVRPIIYIGYNYNVRKVLSFSVTEVSGRINSGIPYLSKCPDRFYNVSIRPVASRLIMYILFGYVNELYSHKKSRQYGSVLENFWVTQWGWLR